MGTNRQTSYIDVSQVAALRGRGILAAVLLCVMTVFFSYPARAQRIGASSGGEDTARITAVTVEEGASKKNMRQNWPLSGCQNWGCLKASNQFVLVKATTKPNNQAIWDDIIWDGGLSVPGKGNNYRHYPCDEAKKFVVKPLMNGKGMTPLQIWVMWATLGIATEGPRPKNAQSFPLPLGQALGANVYGNDAFGQICAVAIIDPDGVHNVAGYFGSGWNIKRRRASHDYRNGVPVTGTLDNGTPVFTSTWVDDTSYNFYKTLRPDNNDKIYDIDLPNIAPESANRKVTYNNFQQWVTWNDEVASKQFSESCKWLWRAKYDLSESPHIFEKVVGPTERSPRNQMIPLPTTP